MGTATLKFFFMPILQIILLFLLGFIIQIEIMEKEVKVSIPFLPFIYNFKQHRELYPIYSYLVFISEAFFVIMFPFNHSREVVDAPMATVIQVSST